MKTLILAAVVSLISVQTFAKQASTCALRAGGSHITKDHSRLMPNQPQPVQVHQQTAPQKSAKTTR